MQQRETLAEKIRRSVFVDGIPQFPSIISTIIIGRELTEYPLPGQLTVGEEFLGQYTLQDQQGTDHSG